MNWSLSTAKFCDTEFTGIFFSRAFEDERRSVPAVAKPETTTAPRIMTSAAEITTAVEWNLFAGNFIASILGRTPEQRKGSHAQNCEGYGRAFESETDCAWTIHGSGSRWKILPTPSHFHSRILRGSDPN